MEYHERLGIPAEKLAAHRDRFEERTHDGLSYHHLPDYRGPLERGTVLVDDPETVVRGFPKVPRTLVLREGIPRHFEGEVVVEEKLDGYNVRVVRLDGEVFAFTRSGIVCPFTTWKVREDLGFDPGPFFDDNPGAMLCGEMVGPENPYTVHDYPGVDSLAFRAFDVRDRESGHPVPVGERRSLRDSFGIEQVPIHGRFGVDTARAEVPHIVQELDARGREGVVLKSPDGSEQLKYTTASANQGDLAFAFSLPFDYGQAFVFRRLIREAFQAVEFGERSEEVDARAHDLGKSILEPMVETIRSVEDGNVAGESHAARGDPGAIEALLSHLRDQGLRIEVERDEVADGERVVEFLKVMRSTTDKTRTYLDGHVVRE
jgi:putative ATP-dependent DNA ligase